MELRIQELDTHDPRVARRFLQIFDWRPWITNPRRDHRANWVVRRWLCSLAPAERWAARVLAHHEPQRDYGDDVRLALRAAGGVPVEPPPTGNSPVNHRDIPVLWWRRLVRRLTAHPDRLRAVEEAEAAWRWLVGGV